MINITIGERCSGKTTKLIERSAKEGVYILTANKRMVGYIADQAKDMGLDIPFPVTVGEYFNSDRFRRSCIRGGGGGLLIDNADLVLKEIFSDIYIHEVTLTDYGNITRLSSLLKEELEDE